MTETPLPQLMVQAEEARRTTVRVSLSLDEADRERLAAVNGLASVDSFAFKADANGVRGQGFKGLALRVEGNVQADVTYTCGVSLKPYSATINAPFSQIFVQEIVEQAEIDLDPGTDDDAEPLVDGGADIADLAFQHFTLALDPYPRHPSLEAAPITASTHGGEEDEAQEPSSPFDVLKDLKLS